MKKKVMSALLATTLVAGLTACGGTKSTDTAASQPEAVDTPVAAETTDAEATEAAPSGETAGTSDSLTTQMDYVFRTCFKDSFQGELAAKYAADNGYTKVW